MGVQTWSLESVPVPGPYTIKEKDLKNSSLLAATIAESVTEKFFTEWRVHQQIAKDAPALFFKKEFCIDTHVEEFHDLGKKSIFLPPFCHWLREDLRGIDSADPRRRIMNNVGGLAAEAIKKNFKEFQSKPEGHHFIYSVTYSPPKLVSPSSAIQEYSHCSIDILGGYNFKALTTLPIDTK